MSNKNLRQSFSNAFAGLSHVLWTQKHVRTQLLIVVLVLVLSYVMKLEKTYVLLILSAIAMVLMAELFNSAIEVVVNMITQTYHPLAKIAKDVAAAAVLIATFYAVLVGGAVFLSGDNIMQLFSGVEVFKHGPAPNPIIVLLLCFGVLSILVVLGKSRKQHGSILQGGAISAHSAVAFLLFASIAIYSKYNAYMTAIAFLLASLVAQSRVEGKIHTLREVIWGAILALVMMSVLVIFTPAG